MSRFSTFILLAVSLFAAACSDPKCPRNLIQRGTYCKRCPEGSVAKHNDCVTLDGGVVVDPIEDDDAASDPGETDDDGAVTDGSDAGISDAQTAGADGGMSNNGGASASMDGSVGNPEAGDDGSQGQTADATQDAAADAGPDAEIDAGPPCYTDNDNDGVGAGQPLSCEGYGTDASSGLSLLNTDCDDNNNLRSSSLTDICGDNVDNDCDGKPDDESNNACGGPCTTQLAHQPGEACSNGLFGACRREGTYQCQGATATVCSAPSIAAGSEVCGDAVDNDCDGSADEVDALDATTWYEDCDGDGYSALTDALIASGVGIRRACTKPAATGSCTGGWTDRRPQAGSTWDCDDVSTVYRPGASFGMPPAGKTRVDLNCDGIDEKESAVTAFEWHGPPAETSPVYAPFTLCFPSDSCEVCASRHGLRWVSAPPCSVHTEDRFDFVGPSYVSVYLGFETCPDGAFHLYTGGSAGYQRCR